MAAFTLSFIGLNEENEKVPALIRLIANRPWFSLALFTSIPAVLSTIGMLNFTLENLDGWDVASSLSSRGFDSYNQAIEEYGLQASLNSKVAQQTQTVPSSDFFHLYYVGSDLLDYNTLVAIAELESNILDSIEMQRSCLQTETMPLVFECFEPVSIANFLPSSISMYNKTSTLTAILGDSEVSAFSLSNNDRLQPPLDGVIEEARTSFKLGLPRPGFSSPATSVNVQTDLTGDDIKAIVTNIVSVASIPNVEVIPDFVGVEEFTAFNTLGTDAVFAVGSLIWVLVLLAIHTRSVFVACCGMLQILLSFPTTYFFYRIVFGIVHFGTLQVLAIFVILGIGADDIFVFFDAFKQSKVSVSGSTAQRLHWAYKKAAVAMLLTSVTTFAAFMVTALSGIMNIRVFGIFASLLVMVNYLLCITILPALMIINERYIKPYPCCFCWPCCFMSTEETIGAEQEETVFVESGIDNIQLQELNPIHEEALPKKKRRQKNTQGGEATLGTVELFYRDVFAPAVLQYRYVVLFLAVTLAAFLGGFGIPMLGPSDKVIQDIYPLEHPMTRLKDLKLEEFASDDITFPLLLVVFGVNLYDRSTASTFDSRKNGQFSFNTNFNFNQTAQLDLHELCATMEASSFVSDVDCWVEDVLNSTNASATLANYDGSVVYINPATDEVLFVVLPVRLAVRIDDPLPERLAAVREVEKALDRGTELGDGFVYNFFYPWWESQETLVVTSQVGLASGLGFAFFVLLVATLSFRVALLSILSICGVVACVLGTIGLIGWDLGFMEAISIVCLVGLAVDYVVHIAIAYVQLQDSDLMILPEYSDPTLLFKATDATEGDASSLDRTRIALTRLGVSIIAGASTTFGAGIFLLFCTIQYLGQFGVFLSMVIAYSLCMSHFMLPPLLAILGPEGPHLSLLHWFAGKDQTPLQIDMDRPEESI